MPQAGILANKHLRRKLAPVGNYESVNTPDLWHHESQPLTFTLVVDDFRVKFVNKEDVNHLISSISTMYKLTKDWTGNLYCSITLKWDCVPQTVDILMPGYMKQKLQEYEHVTGNKRQTCPYSPKPKTFGTEAQAPLSHNTSPHLNAKGIKHVEWIVGSILYHARAVDMKVLMALSSISVKQMHAMEKNNGTMHPIIGLPLWPLKCGGPILRIGHDIKYTF